MKGKVFCVSICFVILFVFGATSISFAGPNLWPNKQGELCWYAYQIELNIEDPLPDPEKANGYVRLNVIKTGNNYYLVHGSNTEPYDEDPPDGTQLANGNAIVYSDTILIHASSSGYGSVK